MPANEEYVIRITWGATPGLYFVRTEDGVRVAYRANSADGRISGAVVDFSRRVGLFDGRNILPIGEPRPFVPESTEPREFVVSK